MSLLPNEVESHYLQSRERERLSADRGELERLRTQAILARDLPSAPAVVVDVGGAAGVYSFPLARQGYQVHLIDAVELHLEQARAHAAASGVSLASIALGDARQLEFPTGCADAVLMLGPLYHLIERRDRIQAIGEARRILKRGGILFAAAISRFASLIDGLLNGFFQDAAFRKIIADDLACGQTRNAGNHPAYFTTAYFHRPEDLAGEISEAGFEKARILAVEGPAWSATRFRETWDDPAQREKLMEFLSLIEREPSLVGASAHVMAVARRIS